MLRSFCVCVFSMVCTLNLFAQQQTKTDALQQVKVPVISGDLGECTADFLVTNVKMKPIYNAKISTDIKYGFAGWHHTALEIYTNSNGKARFEGLPRKSRGPLSFTVDYKGRATAVVVEPRDKCHGSFTAILPNEPLPSQEDDSADE